MPARVLSNSNQSEQLQLPFLLNLDGYEGPIDMLLSLAREQKVDLSRIAVLPLAEQYLTFIEKAQKLDLEIAADYLVMASLLAYLKSKLLLPNEDEGNLDEIEEDLTQRLVHYDAIKKLAKKIFDLPQDGKDFHSINIRNEFTISSKIVPKTTLHDLILRYSELYKRKNSIKVLSEESDLYSMDDGLRWLEKLFDKKGKEWLFLFNFLPKSFKKDEKYKSAVISLLLASLNKVSEGQIIMNQKKHYDKIMVKLKNG